MAEEHKDGVIAAFTESQIKRVRLKANKRVRKMMSNKAPHPRLMKAS
jgi:hypothetical protein